jgi:indolepyruvate ferredoxin oxidoreductase, alpha subunit
MRTRPRGKKVEALETVQTIQTGGRVMTVNAAKHQTRIHRPEVEIAQAADRLAGEPGRLGGELLLGNEAIALGALHAGVTVATGYPGTPSTELIEYLAGIASADVQVGWATNEKVALDEGIGASLVGARALVTMKHVGLNVALDAWMVSPFVGVGGGLVVFVADDPGMHSSQNEQDTRVLAAFAGVPVFEPSDSQEAYDFTRAAFAASEAWDTPVLIRSTTRVSHSRSRVIASAAEEAPTRRFERHPQKYVMLPGNARKRHAEHLLRLNLLGEWAEGHPVNRVEPRSRSLGVITGGAGYNYVREVLPEASVLKLGVMFPIPQQMIRDFAATVDRLVVVEELEPYLEDGVRRLGLAVEGKRWFPRAGELSPSAVRAGSEAAGIIPASSRADTAGNAPASTPRPPVLCPGCPHTTPFLVLRELDAIVAGDIGCYTLAAGEPLKAMDTCLAMGSGIGVAVGMAKAGPSSRPIVATIGDSTLLHGGIPALIDAAYNDSDITVVILDNGTTAMTGGQPNAASGTGIHGGPTAKVDFLALCRSIGVKSVVVVDPYDLGGTHRALLGAVRKRGLSVVITTRPCREMPTKLRGRVYEVDPGACNGCQLCMDLGCPGLSWDLLGSDDHRQVGIDPDRCSGCTVCAQLCPQQAIHPAGAGNALLIGKVT